MLKALKIRVLRVARGLGVMEAVSRSRWRRARLLILCYHSIAVDQEQQWRRSLFFTIEEFEARLELIRRRRLNVLPLEEAIHRLREGTLPDRSAALTFDDGSADFHDLVAPRLLRLGYPATVYVTTYYIEKGLPIFSLMIPYLLWKGRKQRIGPDEEFGLEREFDLAAPDGRAAAEKAILARVEQLGLPASAREAVAGTLAERLGVNYAELRRRRVLELMTGEETARVARQGFDVQLHTHRHRTPRVQAEFADEIAQNRRRLEAMTSRTATHFCYPRGVHFPEYPSWLADLGVVSATTCIPGLADITSSPLLLPRVIDTAGLSPVEFEGWLSGVSHFLPRRRIT